MDDVGDVIDRLQGISARLPAGDGVRAFNEMYLETTRQVGAAVAGRDFADPQFMQRLDAAFAGLYVDALTAYERDPGSAPRSWRALFDARARSGIPQVRFAVAGMNAHINYDLATALVATAREFGGTLGGGRQQDFDTINAVLAQTAPAVRQTLLTGVYATIDDVLGEADDRVSLWAIERARDFAWAAAQARWQAGDSPLAGLLDDARDRMVEMSSRMLLLIPGP